MGPGGRRFESCLPDEKKQLVRVAFFFCALPWNNIVHYDKDHSLSIILDNNLQSYRSTATHDLLPAELAKSFYHKNEPRVNLHIREQGRFNQRYPLLCRDYLRSHPLAAKAYEEIKTQLAHHFPNNADAYYDIKDPVFDIIMAGAEDWATATGWELPGSDA